MPKIAQLWDLFVQAESSSYEKSVWYDLFLSQFIADIHNGKTVEEVLSFCNNWSGAGTLIGCELLSDINQVCSQPGDGDDLYPLRYHLFKKGWKSLTVLLALGQKSFSCSHELANLLISLYPACLETTVKSSDASLPKDLPKNKYIRLNCDVIDSCFMKLPSKSKYSNVYRRFLPRTEYFKSNANSITSGTRKNHRGFKNLQNNYKTDSSESDTPSDGFDVINKSSVLRIRLDPMDFDYFTNVIRSDDENRLDSVLYEPKRLPRHLRKISASEFMDDVISDVMNSQVSPFELTMLIIQLLISLCRSEPAITISSDNSYPVCSKTVKFALENLCSIQFGSVPLQGFEIQEAADLKSSLNLLLAISLEKVLGCPDITTNVILTGILPMMLRVLEDSVCKLKSEFSAADQCAEVKDLYERDKQLEVIFGLICSSVTFLLSILFQNSSVNHVRNFLELFKIFIESSCGKLIVTTILVLSKLGNTNRAKKVIDLLGELIIGMKKVRKEIVSPNLCKRFKHRRCKVNDEMHHHDDRFGNIYSPTVMGTNCLQNCSVSSLFMVFVRLLKVREKLSLELVNKIIKVMSLCGTCCCFTSKNLFQCLAEIIQHYPQKTRVLVYHLLENTIYPEMGYFKSQNKACICFKNNFESSKEDITRLGFSEPIYFKRVASLKDVQSDKSSVHSENQSDCSLLDNQSHRKFSLNLDLFHQLLLSNDFKIVHGVTVHLLKCAPKMNCNAKHIVFFNVFFQTFITSKERYLSGHDDTSVFRILSSLSLFSSLLGNKSFAEQFVNLKGLNHILELISIPIFSKHCCSVLEKTIIVAVLTPEADNSFIVLRDAVDEANKLFFKLYVTEKEFSLDASKIQSAMGVKRRSGIEKPECKNVIKKTDVLQQVCTFWRTYANLTMVSPILREYFSNITILQDCKNILETSLNALTISATKLSAKNKVSKARDFSEGHLFTKLIQSLLTFILATMANNEKGEIERNQIIFQLSDALLKTDLRNVDVRRLAEVLLKCSLVQPSSSQALPYGSVPKLPFMTLWCTWDDDCQDVDDMEVIANSESSSLEENYVTADEGYEADIEIRDSGTSHGELYESNSSWNISDTVSQLTSRDCLLEKSDLQDTHLIVHPKLCSLAIDLIIKLYTEKSVDEEVLKKNVNKKSRNQKSKNSPENLSDKKEKDVEHLKKYRMNTRNWNVDQGCSGDELDPEKSNKKMETHIKSKPTTDTSGEDKCLLSFLSIFHRLVSLCRDKVQNCVILCQDGIILKILNGFRKCLSERNEKYSELQRVILDLITILGSYSMSKNELACYLELFKTNNPPVDHLLNPLTSIVANSKLQPVYSLRFPVPVMEKLAFSSNSDIGTIFHIRHKREGILSSWASAGLSIPIGSDMNWSVWMQGFSISMWMKIERIFTKNNIQSLRSKSPQKSSRKTSKAESHISYCSTLFSDYMMSDANNDDYLSSSPVTPGRVFQISLQNHMHIFTVGNEHLAVECWASTDSDILVWRLSRNDSHRGYEILAETTSKNCMPNGLWHFFAINVRDFVHRKKTAIELTLFVNGWNEMKVLLPFGGLLLRKPRPSSLLLGQQSEFIATKFYFSSIMLYNCPVFSKEKAVYLHGLGPDCSNLTDCQIGRCSPNFTSILGARTVGHNISWDMILNKQIENVKELRDSLLLAYSAGDFTKSNSYPLNSVPASTLLFPGFRPGSSETRGAQRLPTVVTPITFATMIVEKHNGILQSTRLLGGSEPFLFLFARIVEISDIPGEQAKSLYLLLKLVQSDCEIFDQFVRNSHYKLIRKVFQSSKCASGLHFIKAILDACCDKPIVQNNGGKFQVMLNSNAIIVNSFLISTILDSWRDWNSCKQENDVLKIFFLSLITLLKDEHPFREFNVSQLNRVCMVDNLLSFCKERLLFDNSRDLDGEVFYSLIEVMKSLMGAPPDFSHIVAVMDCLIILHPGNATYITHSKSSFYFLLSAGQTCSNYGPMEDQKALYEIIDNDDNRSSSNNKYDDNRFLNGCVENNFYSNKEDAKSNRTNLNHCVDPAKLNKALKNLKLKQKRQDASTTVRMENDDMDSNKYSDDHTFDSGIAGSYREHVENFEEKDEIIVKAIDGSQQNLTSFFPSVSCLDVDKRSSSPTVEENKSVGERKHKEVREDCGVESIVTEGLLLLLRDTILILPDNMAYQILNHVIKLEALLVFANHKDHKVRSAVVKVISAYLQRSSDGERNKFIKMRGFHHLADQISLYPASLQLVEDCLQLIMRCSVSLKDQMLMDQCEITSFGMVCIPPLLSLLPRSVHDPSLVRNLILFFRKIYAKDGNFTRQLLENGLLETLVKALVASAHVNIESSEEIHLSPTSLEIVSFFTFIVNHALITPGINLQVINDIKLELYYVYRLERENCGLGKKCVRVIRDAMCKILEKGLDLIQNKINTTQAMRGKTSFFSSARSSFQHETIESDRGFNQRGFRRSSANTANVSNTSNQPFVGREVPRGELCERFKMFIINTTEFFIYLETLEGKYVLSQTELNFIYHLVPNMLQVLSSTLGKRSYGWRSAANGIYWAVREVLKTEMSELVVWLLSPRQMVKTRMYLINTLIAQAKTRDLVPLLLQTHPQIEQKFSIFLWDLMYNTKLHSTEFKICQELKESLLQWGVLSSQVVGNSLDAWRGDCAVLINDVDKQISAWERKTEAAILRCITKHDGLIKNLTDEALSMTSIVVEAQNVERKSVMEKMRSNYSKDIQITTKWTELINQLCHERAVWFFEKGYPSFWQLDPTEGPSRVRKRLSRCHLGIDGRYLLPTHRHKLDNENYSEPLAFLFENHHKNCSAMILTERLHCNEKIMSMFFAKVVTPSTEIPGELLIGETCIYFVADDRHKYLNTFGISSTIWPFEDVREIHKRRYKLQEKAMEIFLVNGKTYLIAFETSKERDDIVAELSDCSLPNRLESDNLGNIMQLWREGLITNWEYLTQLNKMAGRSFNDLMQYPVFPFILSDYQSPVLDLTNKAAYRNFKKPMAVQEKKNEQHYINNYNELLNGLKQSTLNKEPYHYGSHYSNSGTVLHFLVRLPPFTKMLLQYQDRNFDLPDRTFHNLHTTWRLASCDSTTDVKELLPEFFFLPEFLVNSQGFNFGIRQNGEVVDNVDLPPWCKKDARKFILVHRQALESDYVTENLPHWIDLVFGYKQTGKAAVEAINVFHPATYCGFNVESIIDPVERTAWETMVNTYGQTPRQLLKQPHPLAVQSLVETASDITNSPIIPCVKGLKWGSYVGSPIDPEPIVIWRQQSRDKRVIVQLVALETSDVLGFGQCTSSILRYSKEKGLGVGMTGFRVALISWSHSDNILRAKIKKELPPLPVVYIPYLDPISVCQSNPKCDQLWIGHASGNISVYRFKFHSERDVLEFSELPIRLQGHSGSVNHICLCRAYSIVVTAAQDGIIIIWDLNNVSYIRSIDLSSQIRAITVSETLGDIASVSQSSKQRFNILSLHSINANFIASVVVEETITAICFSTAPEGISINVIACGLSNGSIRLYSSWNLAPVRDINNSSVSHSVISLTYSSDSQLLYVSYSDASVMVWESPNFQYGNRMPKLMDLTAVK